MRRGVMVKKYFSTSKFINIKTLLIVITIFVFTNFSEALCIKTESANIRLGPSTSYKKAWTVGKYMPLVKVGLSLDRNWYAVKDVDGDVNWVHRSLVSDQIKCGVVKAKKVNVRGGPSTKYSKLGFVEKYYSFKVIKIQGNWVKFQDQWGDSGWIHKSYLWIP